MHLDDIGPRRRRFPPDVASHHFLADDGVSMLHQIREELELAVGELKGTSLPSRYAVQPIDFQSLDAQSHLLRKRPTPQQCPEPCEQLVKGERLDQIVIGPCVESFHAIVDGVSCSQHQDRLQKTLFAQLPQKFQAAAVGQHQIEDNNVRGFPDCLPRLTDGSGPNDIVFLLPKTSDKVSQDSLLVFDHENSSHALGEALCIRDRTWGNRKAD